MSEYIFKIIYIYVYYLNKMYFSNYLNGFQSTILSRHFSNQAELLGLSIGYTGYRLIQALGLSITSSIVTRVLSLTWLSRGCKKYISN